MASIDVSDAFDPSFMDSGIICMRLTQTVDDQGVATDSAAPISFTGEVVPDEGANLIRLPDGSRVRETLSIYTMFQLRTQRAGMSADIVTWKGAQYTVAAVDDYMNYGRGFVVAKCELLQLSGA